MIKKYSHSIILFFAAGLLLSLISCNPAAKYEKTERESIQNYLAANPTLNFVKEPSGLYYLETLTGTGRQAVKNDTVFVTYTGKYLNGTTIDSNVGLAYDSFLVGGGWRIAGYDEAITYMKAGGKATILIPSSLGYGSQGYYSIAGYTPLLFDIELVKVSAGVGNSK
jgi:FKBP-type peptidyl-prolyl cis-trans isomerase